MTFFNRRPARRVMAFLCVFIALMAVLYAVQPSVQPAEAHGYIVRAIPPDRAVLTRSPSRLQIWFSENLEPKFSQLSLADEKGNAILLQDSGVPTTNPGQLSARLPATLPDGPYVETIRAAFASDGHVVTETLVFWVGQQIGQVASEGPSREAIPLEVLWRVLTLAGLGLLFGTTLLYQVVLLPGWGNVQYRAGKLPPRVMTRLYALGWTALILAALSTILALMQQTSVFFGADVNTVLQNNLWSAVLRNTEFGDVLTLRIGLIIAAGAILGSALYFAPRQPELVSLLWALDTVIAGALLGTLSASSHAAGSTLWPITSVAVDWLHLLATGAWIGGLVALAIALPAALSPLAGARRRAALIVVLRRFSSVGVSAVVLIAVTGFYSATLQVRQPSDLTYTNYGLTLLAKIILIVPVLVIALYHHFAVAPDQESRQPQRLRRLFSRFEDLVSSVRLESSLGTVVIVFAALLTATPPPVPPEALTKIEPPSKMLTVSDLQVKLTVDPGAAGSNTYEVDLTRNGQPLIGAQVWFQVVYPPLDERSTLLLLDDAGDGTYLGAGADLERSGDWTAVTDVSSAAGTEDQPLRAAFRWTVTDTAPTPTTRQPTILNWLSLASIILAGCVLFAPGAARGIRALHLQTEGVLIGLLAAAATIALLILGSLWLANSAQRSEALRNPVPQVVNPIFPDANSVTAGKTIYEAHCAACHGETGAGDGPQAGISGPPDLRNRLPNRRDETLFTTLLHHKGLNSTLSDNDRWNVINYLRSAVFVPPH